MAKIVFVNSRFGLVAKEAAADGYESFIFATRDKDIRSRVGIPYKILGFVQAIKPDLLVCRLNSSGDHLQIVKLFTGSKFNFFEKLKAFCGRILVRENDCFKAYHTYHRAMSVEEMAELYRHVDAVAVDSIGIADAYYGLGVSKVFVLPNHVYPPYWTPGALGPYKIDVCLAGHKRGFIRAGFVAERAQLARIVADMEGVKFSIYGRGWDDRFQGHRRGIVSPNNLRKIFKMSKICLNHVQITPFNQPLEWYYGVTNGRLFEITASGGFCLSSYTPGLELYFDIGKEIEVYRTLDELKTRIRYYLDHEDERHEIASKGQERTLRDYTYKNTWHLYRDFLEGRNSSSLIGSKFESSGTNTIDGEGKV